MESDDRKKVISGLPSGLPPTRSVADSIEEASLSNNFEKARLCPRCSKPGRVVSNYLGVNVHCGPCGIHWPITNSPLRPEIPSSGQRGLHKQTHVEPDWNIAFDKDVGDL